MMTSGLPPLQVTFQTWLLAGTTPTKQPSGRNGRTTVSTRHSPPALLPRATTASLDTRRVSNDRQPLPQLALPQRSLLKVQAISPPQWHTSPISLPRDASRKTPLEDICPLRLSFLHRRKPSPIASTALSLALWPTVCRRRRNTSKVFLAPKPKTLLSNRSSTECVRQEPWLTHSFSSPVDRVHQEEAVM
nr:MAG: hypothetical protein [Plasmopara viticola lesion associated narnavirus 4]